MVKETSAVECTCDVCGYRWVTKVKPPRCAKCKSRRWNGGKVPAGKKMMGKISVRRAMFLGLCARLRKFHLMK